MSHLSGMKQCMISGTAQKSGQSYDYCMNDKTNGTGAVGYFLLWGDENKKGGRIFLNMLSKSSVNDH